MICNIIYNSKTAKLDSKITNIREIYGCIEVSLFIFFCLLIFRSIIRVNIRTGGNKNRDFQFYFFQFAK